MTVQYCFRIKTSKEINWDKLKNYVKKLYTRKSDIFKAKFPFFVLANKSEREVCVKLKGSSKRNLQEIERVHNSLKSTDLIVNSSTKLEKPTLFALEIIERAEIQREGEKKWSSIVQSGPYFPHLSEPYKSLNGEIMYKGKKYKLSQSEEKAAVLWADLLYRESLGNLTERRSADSTFRKNYWSSFKKYLSKDHKKVFKKFSEIGWKPLVAKVASRKEKIKGRTKEQKEKIATKNKEKECKYGYAYLDHKREKLDSYAVELQGLFIGRGKHPGRGKIKPLIFPEDVELNIGVDDPVPKAPKGHKWGNILHDTTATWLSRWKDKISGKMKYVRFGKTGKFKAFSNLSKFYKVRKLQKNIETVRKKYRKYIVSKEAKKRQLGTVLWLIDHYGIRAGGEKGDDEAETVGASTLKRGNVKIEKDSVTFDFLGKDSIRYKQKIKIDDKNVLENFREFVKGKGKNADLFDKISAESINLYLKSFDSDFTAKVFRTRLASYNMFKELEKLRVSKAACTQKKNKALVKEVFVKANEKVAKILNHVKNLSVKGKEALKKAKTKIREKKEELKRKEKEGKKTDSLKKTIKNMVSRLNTKKMSGGVALNTSLNNYIDPRIVVAWGKNQCSKRKDMDPVHEMIYSKQQQDSFKWAFNTSPQWNWLTSPLRGSEKLHPLKDCISAIKKGKGFGRFTPLVNFCRKPTKNNIKGLLRMDKAVWDWAYKAATEAKKKKGEDIPYTARLVIKYYKKIYNV